MLIGKFLIKKKKVLPSGQVQVEKVGLGSISENRYFTSTSSYFNNIRTHYCVNLHRVSLKSNFEDVFFYDLPNEGILAENSKRA